MDESPIGAPMASKSSCGSPNAFALGSIMGSGSWGMGAPTLGAGGMYGNVIGARLPAYIDPSVLCVP